MTLGATNKKQIWFLAAAGVLLAYLFYANVLAGPDVPPSSNRAANGRDTQPGAGSGILPTPQGTTTRRALSKVRTEEFHPVYMDRNPANRRDPKSIDPTLQLERFSKVQSVELSGGARNLFQFSQAPPKEAPVLVASKEPLVVPYMPKGPRQPTPPGPPPPPPPPPPITLKFYGFSTSEASGRKTAYLLDGEDILLAREGDTLKRRYKIVRIGPNSILVEDLDARRQQSVPLSEEGAS